jgi:hypothetical protein
MPWWECTYIIDYIFCRTIMQCAIFHTHGKIRLYMCANLVAKSNCIHIDFVNYTIMLYNGRLCWSLKTIWQSSASVPMNTDVEPLGVDYAVYICLFIQRYFHLPVVQHAHILYSYALCLVFVLLFSVNSLNSPAKRRRVVDEFCSRGVK